MLFPDLDVFLLAAKKDFGQQAVKVTPIISFSTKMKMYF
jgi:hypothetical protein